MAEPRKPRVIKTRPGAEPAKSAPTESEGSEDEGSLAEARKVVPAKAASPKSLPVKPASKVLGAGAGPDADGVLVAGGARSAKPKTPGPQKSAEPVGAVRSTSDKVSVVAVPKESESVDEPHSARTRPKVTLPKSLSRLRSLGRAGTSEKPLTEVPQTKKPQTEKPQTEKPLTENSETRAGAGAAKDPTSAKGSKGTRGSQGASNSKAAGRIGNQGSDNKGSDNKGSGTKNNGTGHGATVLTFPVPEYKARRKKRIIAAATVVVVLAMVMAGALFSPALAVRTIVFDGQKIVAEKTLADALAPIMDRPLPQVTDGEVQSLLAPVVQVKSSYIEARPPSTLVVHLVERIPVALLKNGGEYLLVDQDGVQLGSTADPASVALPLIDGGKAAIGKDTFRAMTAVLANLPQSILKQLANATAKSPDAVELKLVDGRQVVWGNASDMELKAQVLQALLNAPPPTVEAGKPVPEPAKVFDVSAPRHPVTR